MVNLIDILFVSAFALVFSIIVSLALTWLLAGIAASLCGDTNARLARSLQKIDRPATFLSVPSSRRTGGGGL